MEALIITVIPNGKRRRFPTEIILLCVRWYCKCGMMTVGDMFNQGLKARVDALCTELASLLRLLSFR